MPHKALLIWAPFYTRLEQMIELCIVWFFQSCSLWLIHMAKVKAEEYDQEFKKEKQIYGGKY